MKLSLLTNLLNVSDNSGWKVDCWRIFVYFDLVVTCIPWDIFLEHCHCGFCHL